MSYVARGELVGPLQISFAWPGKLLTGNSQLAPSSLWVEGWKKADNGLIGNINLFAPKLGPLLTYPCLLPFLQDWATEQATRLRYLLGHLHGLSRRATAARRLGERDLFSGIPMYPISLE